MTAIWTIVIASLAAVKGAPQQIVAKKDPLATAQRSAIRAHNLHFPYKSGEVLDESWPCSGLQSFELSESTPLEPTKELYSEEGLSNFVYQLGRDIQAGVELPRLWHNRPSASPIDIITKEDTLKLLEASRVNFIKF